MSKNYILAFVNVLIFALPALFMYDVIIYLFYALFLVIIILLFAWNAIGDFIIVRVVYRGKKLPTTAMMKPSVDGYINYLRESGLVKAEKVRCYWANRRSNSFIQISPQCCLISNALDDPLIKYGAKLLINSVSAEMYKRSFLISRKVLLLSIVGYAITLRILELWAVFVVLFCRVLMAIVMLITSGSLFGTASEAYDAMTFGSLLGLFLGKGVIKLDKLINIVQDTISEFFANTAVDISINEIDCESIIRQRSQR